ncbi:FtsQ-type POTRA domain-containing protein [Leifsonia sp. F6_8S_P_1B]|uniref:FtsQ-type POTRA domain-containing protein n=1 Tax=Leifsonia williamsii TaxID=3035919 RepID=A0ABT8KDT5_9MICO|nr:FtsQ-type POTRA domain-containing protein [Leifsonia williamsii]MDN4615619.1 FtsQ-type POTRA domain-containing protein [Leifsonia williamsii]
MQTVTAPIPLVRPAGEEAREAPQATDAASTHSPYDALPTNREISKALRAARKERRRIERGEVRRFTKRSRRRRLAWLAAAGVVALLVLGVAGVAVSPLLALRHIEITGASRLDAADIRAKLGDQLGTPLPMLDQAAISSDLAAFPLIRSYSLESHPPDTLVVRIEERQPVGVIQKGSVFTLVDAAKVPISSSQTRPEGYPLVTAAGGSAETDADSAFAAAAGVLSALPPTVLAQVDTISAKTKDDVSFTLRGSGATVVWGSAEDSDLKAADLTALLAGASGANRYDVSSPHSVTTG